MWTQAETLEKIRPILEQKGILYQKNKNVYARAAEARERIDSYTADGLETTNAAHAGDFIVRNQTGAAEEYIVPAHKFNQRYVWLREHEEGWAEYQSLGQVIALELDDETLSTLEMPDTFHFTAPWGEAMVAKTGDFLVGPPALTEVYRIARQEFFETYRKAD
ncbi:MAG: hypothetical protein IT260_02930 [Saprospiraceae bacterium]|nr:hypothetical protein [Saprospiraceae bacterium]